MMSDWKYRSLLYWPILLMSLQPAMAQTAANQCAAISNPADRLACYDAANAGQQKAESPPSQPPSHWPEFGPPGHPSVATKPSTPRRNNSETAGVTSYQMMPNGRFAVTLDNGEVWRQLESDNGRAQFRGRNRVIISPGFWHSYDLKLNNMNTVFKVERVK